MLAVEVDMKTCRQEGLLYLMKYMTHYPRFTSIYSVYRIIFCQNYSIVQETIICKRHLFPSATVNIIGENTRLSARSYLLVCVARSPGRQVILTPGNLNNLMRVCQRSSIAKLLGLRSGPRMDAGGELTLSLVQQMWSSYIWWLTCYQGPGEYCWHPVSGSQGVYWTSELRPRKSANNWFRTA